MIHQIRLNSYSQFNIDIYLVNLFKDQPEGFFIEAGANDGVDQNNTFLLEKVLNWKGMLIEPNPHAFSKCSAHRNCILEKCALVPFDYEFDYIEGDFESTDSMMGGCSNIHKKVTKAKACKLSDLLNKHNISKIDFFSIDVEGYEIEAMNGLDFETHSPSYILYEDHKHRNVEYSQKFEDYFENKNYKLHHQFSDNHYLFKLEM